MAAEHPTSFDHGPVAAGASLRPALHRVPLRRLFTGPTPAPERVFYHNIWMRNHRNSPQIEGLIPRIRRLDCYLSMCSDQWLLRAVQFRALMAAQDVRHRLVIGTAAKRYRGMLAHRAEQIPFFSGPVVAQIDDPKFDERQAALLNLPQVAVVVFTAERALRKFERLGVDKPSYILPLGSEVESLSEASVRAVHERYRRPGEVVIGYIGSTLRLPGDRHAEEPLHNVAHLLDMWEEIHVRVPQGRLWLVGDASERLRARVAGRDDILLLGTIPQTIALNYVAAFDIALYPRTADQGVRASKIADYMGAGVPTVSYDYEVVDDLRDTGAGLLARTRADFVAAVERLAHDEAERSRLAEAAKRAGAERDWRVVAPTFERDVLDRYLA